MLEQLLEWFDNQANHDTFFANIVVTQYDPELLQEIVDAVGNHYQIADDEIMYLDLTDTKWDHEELIRIQYHENSQSQIKLVVLQNVFEGHGDFSPSMYERESDTRTFIESSKVPYVLAMTQDDALYFSNVSYKSPLMNVFNIFRYDNGEHEGAYFAGDPRLIDNVVNGLQRFIQGNDFHNTGALIYGENGTGKTSIAKQVNAICGNLDIEFQRVDAKQWKSELDFWNWLDQVEWGDVLFVDEVDHEYAYRLTDDQMEMLNERYRFVVYLSHGKIETNADQVYNINPTASS